MLVPSISDMIVTLLPGKGETKMRAAGETITGEKTTDENQESTHGMIHIDVGLVSEVLKMTREGNVGVWTSNFKLSTCTVLPP